MFRSKFQKMFECYEAFGKDKKYPITMSAHKSKDGISYCSLAIPSDLGFSLSDICLDMIKANRFNLSHIEIFNLIELFQNAKEIETSNTGFKDVIFLFNIPYVKPVEKHVIQSLLESAKFYTTAIQDPPQWHAYREDKYAVPGKLIFQAASKEKATLAIMKQMTDANKSEVLAHIDTLDRYSGGTSQHEDDYYIFPNIMYSDY